MFKKTGIFTFLMAIALPAVAHPPVVPLTIVNNASTISTIKFNGICSGYLGEAGITQPHQTKRVDDDSLWANCLFGCDAEVFANDAYCTGQPIGKMHYETKVGTTVISNPNNRITTNDDHTVVTIVD